MPPPIPALPYTHMPPFLVPPAAALPVPSMVPPPPFAPPLPPHPPPAAPAGPQPPRPRSAGPQRPRPPPPARLGFWLADDSAERTGGEDARVESAEYMLTVRALGHHLERGETAQEWAERLDEYRFTKVAVAAAEEASAASAETAAALAAEVATQAAAAEQRRRVWDARALALPSHEGLATTIRLNLPLMPHGFHLERGSL